MRVPWHRSTRATVLGGVHDALLSWPPFQNLPQILAPTQGQKAWAQGKNHPRCRPLVATQILAAEMNISHGLVPRPEQDPTTVRVLKSQPGFLTGPKGPTHHICKRKILYFPLKNDA